MSSTAFPETERAFRESMQSLRIDEESVAQPRKICDLKKCGAACCHDGAVLSDEEMEVIEETVDGHSEHFEKLGIGPTTPLFQRVKSSDWQTALKEAYPEQRSLLPKEFPPTRCIFLLPDYKCSLQSLAMKEGKHPWFWKPIACWMHPLTILIEEQPTLIVPSEEDSDKTDLAEFTPLTPCGKIDDDGNEAALGEEREFLGEILRED